MKSKEEIEQLAEKLYGEYHAFHKVSFVNGYTQCQEDMTDKKYTEKDLMRAITFGHNIPKPESPDDEYHQYKKDFIQSLNKQD